MLLQIFARSVHITSRLDGQSSFQMFSLFYGCHVGGAQCDYILGSVNLRI